MSPRALSRTPIRTTARTRRWQTPATSGLLANDTDPEGDPLTAALVDGASHGSLTLNPDGSFSYQPNEDFVGQDSFSYTANDGSADSGLATATIAVGPGCDGRPATVTGTAGANNLQGTSSDDVIAGLGGGDTIRSSSGHDTVCGGSGNDVVDGGAGNDNLIDATGNDRLFGGAGNDRLFGGADNDALRGEAGSDLLSGGAGSLDTCDGGPGTDELAPNHGCEISGIP